MDFFLSYDTHDDMVNTPTMDEVHTASCCIPGNKASDNSGILPEMVKVLLQQFAGVSCEVVYPCLGQQEHSLGLERCATYSCVKD